MTDSTNHEMALIKLRRMCREIIDDYLNEHDLPKAKALVICSSYRKFDAWCIDNGYDPRDGNNVRWIHAAHQLYGLRNTQSQQERGWYWEVAHIDPTCINAEQFNKIMDQLRANGLLYSAY